MKTRLQITGIKKSFGPVEVLHGVDLEVGEGEIVGLLGENGAGKSTLMNIVSGEIAQDEGSIRFDGNVLELESVGEGIELGIRFVHQELSTIGSLSIAENLFLNDYLANSLGVVDKRLMASKARTFLSAVGLQNLDPASPVSNLGPGQQQLIELAKAIVVEPRLLIMDEPTSSLTPIEAAKLFELVRELSRKDVPVILITHKLDEAIEHCDRIVVLRDGVLVRDSPATEATKPILISSMIGKESTYSWKGTRKQEGPPQLSIQGLKFGVGHKPIDLEVAEGEVVALFGLIGAGRTTFLETLFGYRRAYAGEVRIRGKKLTMGDLPASVTGGMAMVPEGRKERSILPQHSVTRNITISSLRRYARFGIMSEKAEEEAVESVGKSFGVRMSDARQIIGQLSGGNQQKAIFGRAVSANPVVLLLDEPTHGVDVGAKSDIHSFIQELASKGLSVLVSSSELHEVLAIADRCAVFSKGNIAGVLDREDMSEDAILSLAFAAQ